MKRLVTLASAVLLVLLIVAGPAAAQVDSQGPGETSVLPITLPRPPGEIGVEDDVIQRGTPVSNTAAASPTTGVAGIQIDRGPLAQTGIQVTTGALLAAILLAGGGLVLVTTRRRSVLA